MKLQVKKLPILLPLLIAAAILVAAAVMTRLGRDSASAHTNLGQKYLNDMNYSGAISEFLQSLSIDPTAQDARIGLAEAYVASGTPEVASEILKPMIDAELPEAYRLLIEGQQDSDPRQALQTAQDLVEHTDLEEDYQRRDALLVQVLAEPHSYAAGIDQVLKISQGDVLSSGSNTLGQLGTDRNLGTESAQDSLLTAGLPVTAARVYCAGRTSFAVDQNGDLWAAGENRWGQMGLSYMTTDPQSGWTKITDTGDVAAAAGTVGALYILKTDGTLWYAGRGGAMAFAQTAGLGAVCAIDSNSRQIAAQAVDGTLYLTDAGDPHRWVKQADHVKTFCLSSRGLTWVTNDNQVYSQSGLGQVPETWVWVDQGVVPDFTVRDVAADANGLLLLGSDGQLRRLFNGQAEVTDGANVTNIYSAEGTVVVEQADGSVMTWDLSLTAPVV